MEDIKEMEDIKRRLAIVELKLAENTALTFEIKDILFAAKTGFRVLGWMGMVVKYIGGIAIGIASLYGAWQALFNHGKFPGA